MLTLFHARTPIRQRTRTYENTLRVRFLREIKIIFFLISASMTVFVLFFFSFLLYTHFCSRCALLGVLCICFCLRSKDLHRSSNRNTIYKQRISKTLDVSEKACHRFNYIFSFLVHIFITKVFRAN